MFVRGYQMSDCKEITELFYNTVHTINAKDYTKEQLNFEDGLKKEWLITNGIGGYASSFYYGDKYKKISWTFSCSANSTS